jgi:hypothetical protein
MRSRTSQAEEKKEALAACKGNCRKAIRVPLWIFEIKIAGKDLSLLLILWLSNQFVAGSIFPIDVQEAIREVILNKSSSWSRQGFG